MSQLFALSQRDQHKLLKRWGWVDIGSAQGGHARLRWPKTGFVVSMTHPSRGGHAKAHAITSKKAAKAMGLTVQQFLAGPLVDAKVFSDLKYKVPEPVLVEAAPQPKETAVSEQVETYSVDAPQPEAAPKRSHQKAIPALVLNDKGEPIRDRHGNIKTDRRGLHMKGNRGNFAAKGIGPAVRDFLMRHPNRTFTIDQVASHVPFNHSQVGQALGTMARSSVSPVQRGGRGRFYWQASSRPVAEAPVAAAPVNVEPVIPAPAPSPPPAPALQLNGDTPDMFEKVADLGGNTYVLRGVDGATYVARLSKVEA